MSLTIEDPETVAAIRRLAMRSERSVEDVVRDAVTEAERTNARPTAPDVPRPLVSPEERERRLAALRRIQAEVARWPKTGLKADKAFFDSLED